MAKSNVSEQPAWQRNPVFEFFAPLKLAVVLLAVLVIAAIAGTIDESSFDAKVARAYVYGAPWFNLWLESRFVAGALRFHESWRPATASR